MPAAGAACAKKYRLADEAPLQELALVGRRVRRAVVPDPQVDVADRPQRQANITISPYFGLQVLATSHCKPHQTDRAFITTMEQYCEKITHCPSGRRPAAVAGRPAPRLKIDFYERLFSG